MGLKEDVFDLLEWSKWPMTSAELAAHLDEEYARRGYSTGCLDDRIDELLEPLLKTGEVMWENGYRIPSLLEKLALAARSRE